jgi:hypothetical protein
MESPFVSLIRIALGALAEVQAWRERLLTIFQPVNDERLPWERRKG